MSSHTHQHPSQPPSPSLFIWIALLFLGIGVYFYGLNSDHLATNGDELVYAQIAKATAQSGHLLPLQSPIQRLENTKPPLLFWQGIFSTNHGKNWSLARLRYPSVVATLLVAFLVLLLGERFTQSWGKGIFAALLYLCFFGVYRYGRCFLTSGPESFWLFLPFFLFLYAPRVSRSWSILPFIGIALGIGLLYKSVFLVIPVSIGIAWVLLDRRGYQEKGRLTWFQQDLPRVVVMSLVSIGCFSLWFLGDPHPGAIVKDFLLRENLGKFDAGGGSYLWNLFIGSSSIWRNVIAYPFNAGLLAPQVLALFYLIWHNHRRQNATQRALWIWVITLFVIFTFPNQRDERYLLLGMPAMALLLLLSWESIPHWLMTLSFVAVGVITAGMGGLSLLLQHDLVINHWPHPYLSPAYWLLLAITLAVVVLGIRRLPMSHFFLPTAILLLYFCYAAFLWPFDGPMGHFSQEAQQAISGKKMWVPTNFNAREESYRFLFPQAGPLYAYDYHDLSTIEQLQARVPRFIVTLPLDDHSVEKLQGAHYLGRRLNLIDRFNKQETQEILHGKVTPLLFHQDLLIESTP